MSEEEREEEQDLRVESRRRGGFLGGVVFGAVLACLCMLLAMFLPRFVRTAFAGGNPGAEVLTSADTRRKLSEVQQIIEEYYLDEVDGQVLQDYLFLGAAAGLEDEYAAYYTAEELSEVMDSTRGEYYGIGAVIGTDQDSGDFYVDQVYKGSPAMEGGLTEGDIVRSVDGESVEELTLSDLVSLIKSKETFTMTVYRDSVGREVDLTLTCAEVQPDYVEAEMLEDGIAYLSLSEFTERAVDQFLDTLDDLNAQGMTALIVDLRGNPGGLLTAVCDILDAFFSEELIVYTEDKNGNREEYFTDEGQKVTCPVAVLVDGTSASASELFAGAIQDYDLGPVIGEQTYGKGVVQKTFELSDGSAFKMTVENYFTPEGQKVDGTGITPDIVVEADEETETDAVLERALQEMTALTGTTDGRKQ